jgi:hypothetical protein
MKRLLAAIGRALAPPAGCPLGMHRVFVPTGAHCFEPIWCSRCGAYFDADTGRWVSR